MSEKSIPFCAEMVCAILKGRKTEMRYVIVPQPPDIPWLHYERGPEDLWCGYVDISLPEPLGVPRLRPPYAIGDLLWVREGRSQDGGVEYAADGARIFLLVEDVWPERLQSMGYGAIAAEGFADMRYSSWDDFIASWDRVNAGRGYSWDSNPWVWAIRFMVKE